ncbi:hypothetical protein LINPERHAP2_LOCUS43081 [Linum perenne]
MALKVVKLVVFHIEPLKQRIRLESDNSIERTIPKEEFSRISPLRGNLQK